MMINRQNMNFVDIQHIPILFFDIHYMYSKSELGDMKHKQLIQLLIKGHIDC